MMELLKRLRRDSLKRVLPLSLLLLAAGIALFFIFGCYDLIQLASPRTLAELTPETMEGAYVEDDVTYFYAAYLQTKEYKDNRYVGVTGVQYVIDFDRSYYMGLSVHKLDLDEAENMMDACDDYYYGKIGADEVPVFHVRGTIEAMDDEERSYYFEAAGGDAGLESIMLPYYVDLNRMNGNTFALMWIMLAVSVALFLGGLVPLIRALTGGYQKKLSAKLAAMGEESSMLERLERFYDSSEPASGVRIGSEFLMFQHGAVTMLFRPWELAWAYQMTTRHRTNGIPTGKSYAAIFRMMDGTQYSLAMKEPQVQALLKAINENAPGVVLGYTKELEQMYQKNRSSFAARWESVRPGCTSRV